MLSDYSGEHLHLECKDRILVFSRTDIDEPSDLLVFFAIQTESDLVIPKHGLLVLVIG